MFLSEIPGSAHQYVVLKVKEVEGETMTVRAHLVLVGALAASFVCDLFAEDGCDRLNRQPAQRLDGSVDTEV